VIHEARDFSHVKFTNNGFSASKSGKKWSWKKETSQECSRSEYQNISSKLVDFEGVKVNIV